MGADDTRIAPEVVDYASAGPGTPGGRFLRRFWQPVFLSRDLPNGRARPIHIMGERFTLYRGEAGSKGEAGIAHIVAYRCAHRSTQLSTGWVRGDHIQCFYHGWTFDGAGACVARPAESRPGPHAEANIAAYPTREHMGIIYGYFGEGEAPAWPPFPAFEGEGIVENSLDEFPCNWFQTYENHADEVHIAFVHSPGGSHRALDRERRLPKLSAADQPYGMTRYTQSDGGPRRSTLYLFPNTMRIIIPPPNGFTEVGGWRDSYLALVPTDDHNHLLFMTQHVRIKPEEHAEYFDFREKYLARCAAARPPKDVARDILDGKLTMDDALDHPKLFAVEDIVAQAGQGSIVDRSLEYLGQSDICITRLRRLFDRELRAMAAGQAGTPWVYSGEPPERGF